MIIIITNFKILEVATTIEVMNLFKNHDTIMAISTKDVLNFPNPY